MPYKGLVFSFPSDLMKTTAVAESLSYYKTNVLFQRISAYFKNHKIISHLCTQVMTKYYRGIKDLTLGKHPLMKQKTSQDNPNSLRKIILNLRKRKFGVMKKIVLNKRTYDQSVQQIRQIRFFPRNHTSAVGGLVNLFAPSIASLQTLLKRLKSIG